MESKSKLMTLLAVAVMLGSLTAVATAADVAAQAPTGMTAQDDPGTDAEAEDAANQSDDTETTTTVSGTLESTSSEDYRLDGLDIDIGAAWYTNETTAATDFDGDGTTETVRSEFDGLVGENVTVTVETDGDEGDVLAVNGDQYREQGPPPWADGPDGDDQADEAEDDESDDAEDDN